MISIYKLSQIYEDGTEAFQLSKKFPNAVSHDGINVVFAGYDGGSAVHLEETANTDSLALSAAKFLFSGDVRGLLMTKEQSRNLFDHPCHRLWCGSYEDFQSDLFISDYNYMKYITNNSNLGITWPEMTDDMNYSDARAIISRLLSEL